MSRKRMMPCIKTYTFSNTSVFIFRTHSGWTCGVLCHRWCYYSAVMWLQTPRDLMGKFMLCFLGVGGWGRGGYKFINSPRTLSLKRILDPEKFHLIKTQDFVINEKYLFFICLIFPNGLFNFSAFRLNTFIQLSWISLPTYYYFDCGSCEIYTRST